MYTYSVADFLYVYKTEVIVFGLFSLILILSLVLIIGVITRSRAKLNLKNKEISVAYEQAKVASIAKSTFLARMSHEIRTPMNAVIGFSTLALDNLNNPDTVKEDIEKVVLSSKILLSILNDVLDMSSIESGKIKIDNSPFDFKTLIKSITAVYVSRCANKGVEFSVKFLSSLPETLVGDSLRLNQILLNLLSNAYKFTSQGHITLSVKETLRNEGKVYVKFIVTDTGEGMSPDMIERMFEPFEQENAKTAREHGGSGLGLSIVKALIGLMNGTIECTSKQGEGTEFTVLLPFGIDESHEEKVSSIDMKHLSVLVVDDKEDALEYAATVLKRIGVQYQCCGSGKEALEELERANKENHPYNVCLIDWKMPSMGGDELTREIRQNFKNSPIVIIISAYDKGEIGAEAKAAGADRFISKPIFQSTLFDTLISLTGDKIVVNQDNKVDYDFSKFHLLLAEDNEINRLVACKFLAKAKFAEPVTAVDGEEVVKKFSESKPGEFDCILMDVQMPKMDGYEATKAIRLLDRPDAKTIPIIAMTANAFNEDVSAAIQAGMDAHISKPIDFDKMCETISETIERKKRNE